LYAIFLEQEVMNAREGMTTGSNKTTKNAMVREEAGVVV
jgi:hypothetical protein